MLLCIEKFKGSIKKLPGLMNSAKLLGTGSTHRSQVYFYIYIYIYMCTEQSEKEIKKVIPFKIASKRIKYLGINLTKEERLIHRKLQNIPERK